MRRKEFIEICKDRKFWQWVNNRSIVPYKRIKDREVFLKDLFAKIKNRTYYPNPPKEYLTVNKGHGVLRIIPVLNLEDLVVFYFCTRKLETYIAVNHVPGTYGGFGLSGKLRRIEEEEARAINENLTVFELDGRTYAFYEIEGYPVESAFNPKAWQAEWGDFTGKIYHNSIEFQDTLEDEEGIVVELDISNFYDSIQLDNLEYKIRKYISNNENEVVYLLLHFLRFWNRHINFYRQQGAGVPQDLFGECSRILANFYLQNYDKEFSRYCEELGCQYFRYADDQVIFIRNPQDIEKLIGKASSLLMREGLNFNQKKVRIMSFDEFRKYYAFDHFLELVSVTDKSTKSSILNDKIDYYLANKENLRKNGISLLKTILKVVAKHKIAPKNLKKLKRSILNSDFFLSSLPSSSDWKLIYNLLTKKEKILMLSIFEELISTSYYSLFLYHIREFYSSINLPTKHINGKIKELKKFYSLV